MVGNPAGDITRIFGDHIGFTGFSVQAVNIEDLRVAFIHADKNIGRVVIQIIYQMDPYAVERRQVFFGVPV